MTPSLPLSASIPAASAPPQKQPRETKEAAKTSEAQTDASLTEKKDVAETSSAVFEELMAALLTMQPAAPGKDTSPTIDIKPPANDEVVAPQYGPALLVTPPQSVPAENPAPSPVNVSGEFCPEFISALTPGIPELPLDTTEATTASVPVPAITEDGSPALKIFNDTPADPRVIAAGLTPQEMEAFKDQLAAAQKPVAPSGFAPQAQPFSSPETQSVAGTAAPAQTTPPVTTNAQMTPPVQPLNVITVNLLPGAEPAPPAAAMAQAADVAAPTDNESVTSDPENTVAVSEETIETGFDPVEFRIAQKYHRSAAPVSQNVAMPQPTSAPAETAPKPAQASLHAAQGAETIKGKVDTDANLSFSLTSSAAPVFGGLTDSLGTALPSTQSLSMTTLTSPVTQNIAASQSHPAVQTVAAIINKAAKENTSQTISLRLDPPDLGKLEVQMKYKKGDPLKVHVVLEKADTAAMFQRDAHALEAALKEAGVQADSSSLSFEMAKDGNSFQGHMNRDENRSPSSIATGSEISENPVLETSIDIATDTRTGLTHYNLRV